MNRLEKLRMLSKTATEKPWVTEYNVVTVGGGKEEGAWLMTAARLTNERINAQREFNAQLTSEMRNTLDDFLELVDAADMFFQGTFHNDYSDYYGHQELRNALKKLKGDG